MAHWCNYCDWETAEPERVVSGCLAAWHVYEDHPDIWRTVIGDRPPYVRVVRAQISGN